MNSSLDTKIDWSPWTTRFDEACTSGDIEEVQLAIANGVNDWFCGFCNASQNGHINIVQLLISKAKSPLNWNMGLYCASLGGHMNIIQLMLKFTEIDINYFFNWDLVLYGACKGGYMEIAQFIISKGATDLFQGFQGACFGGHMHMIEFIISKASEWKANGKSESNGKTSNWWGHGLRYACSGGHIRLVEFIMSRSTTYSWSSAFLSAQANDHTKIIALLISKDLDSFNYLAQFYSWPIKQTEIFQLLYLGVEIPKFSKITGYQKLQALATSTKQSILRSTVLLSDLLNLVSKYIII